MSLLCSFLALHGLVSSVVPLRLVCPVCIVCIVGVVVCIAIITIITISTVIHHRHRLGAFPR